MQLKNVQTKRLKVTMGLLKIPGTDITSSHIF